jgi:hypothetical protein
MSESLNSNKWQKPARRIWAQNSTKRQCDGGGKRDFRAVSLSYCCLIVKQNHALAHAQASAAVG